MAKKRDTSMTRNAGSSPAPRNRAVQNLKGHRLSSFCLFPLKPIFKKMGGVGKSFIDYKSSHNAFTDYSPFLKNLCGEVWGYFMRTGDCGFDSRQRLKTLWLNGKAPV